MERWEKREERRQIEISEDRYPICEGGYEGYGICRIGSRKEGPVIETGEYDIDKYKSAVP